jgi:Protein of unknown function (DUF4199)
MKKVSPLVSIGVRSGLIAGVVTIVFLIASFYAGLPVLVSPFLDFRIFLFGVFIFFALREFRESYQQGELYFSQGMIISFVFVMVAGVAASLLVLVFGLLEPSFVDGHIKALTEYFKSFTPEEIERFGKETYQRNSELVLSTNAEQIASRYFIHSLAIGLFVSIILSVILRKQPKQD